MHSRGFMSSAQPIFSSYVPFCIIPADYSSQLGLSSSYLEFSFLVFFDQDGHS